METLLKVEGINVYYGAIHAIKDISFQVNQGEIVTLIGANGAGKTTTLQTISGLLRSKTGSILFDGQDINTVSADKLVGRGLAQVPEGRRVFLQMSVEENLEMGAYTQPPAGVPRDLEMVYDLFPRLKERRSQVAGTLSGGERQRIKLAKHLGKKGSIIVMDEPTTGLHMSDIKNLLKLFDLIVSRGNTLVVIEHNLDVMKQADWIIDIGPDGGNLGGRVVFTGTPEEMVKNADTLTADSLRAACGV